MPEPEPTLQNIGGFAARSRNRWETSSRRRLTLIALSPLYHLSLPPCVTPLRAPPG